jgi:hypothetical protein
MIAWIRCRSQLANTPGVGLVGAGRAHQQPSVLAFAIQLGVASPNPVTVPSQVPTSSSRAPKKAVVGGVVAVAGVAELVRAPGGGPRAATDDRGAVGQPQPLGRAGGVVGQPAPAPPASDRPPAAAGGCIRAATAAGEQAPDPCWGGPQPVVPVVVAQQHLDHRQADQLGVGARRWAARAAAGRRVGMIRSVNSTYRATRRASRSAITARPLGRTRVNMPFLGTLRHPRTTSHQPTNSHQRSSVKVPAQ